MNITNTDYRGFNVDHLLNYNTFIIFYEKESNMFHIWEDTASECIGHVSAAYYDRRP